MTKLRVAFLHSLLLAVLALSACGDSGDDSDEKADTSTQSPAATRDAGRSPTSTMSDPIGDLINTVLGDGGSAGLGDLLGDGGLPDLGTLFGEGGLAGLGGLFGDAGLPNLGASGFDPSTLCAQVPGFCPDGGIN